MQWRMDQAPRGLRAAGGAHGWGSTNDPNTRKDPGKRAATDPPFWYVEGDASMPPPGWVCNDDRRDRETEDNVPGVQARGSFDDPRFHRDMATNFIERHGNNPNHPTRKFFLLMPLLTTMGLLEETVVLMTSDPGRVRGADKGGMPWVPGRQ